MPWRDMSSDPGSQVPMEHRRQALKASEAGRHLDRVDVIREYCTDQRVLDVGCVDHDASAQEREDWLHRVITDVARECVGVDFELEGVENMRAQGYNVVAHDITQGPGSLADEGLFDVVVAGEIVEHLDTPRALFDLARDVLRVGGHLIVTTPNPYGRTRVRAGQLGIVWENTDHVLYLPPTGAVELAERTGGLQLILFGSDDQGAVEVSPRQLLSFLKKWLLGDRSYLASSKAATPLEWFISALRPSLVRGETMTYVFRRV